LLVKLGKSEKTVDTEFKAEKAKFDERYKIMKEFELKTNSDLLRFAIRERIIS